MLKRFQLLAGTAVALSTFFLTVFTAHAQRGPAAGALSATYKGPTTTNLYTPIPTSNPDGTTTTHPAVKVEAIPDALRRQFNLNTFYKKSLVIRGIPVIGSEKVSDFAFLECAFVVDHMLKDSPKWVPDALVQQKVRIGIISVVEYTMDMPENQNPRNNDPA
ncbi:MAG TPA: hypothetical protein VGN88_12405, partial [Phycisphaerae bacterium]